MLLVVLLTHAGARAQLEPDPEAGQVAEVEPRVERAFVSEERVRVFLILRGDSAPQATQDALIASLGADFALGRRYRNIPALAGLLSRAGLARARHNPVVEAVQLDGTGSGGLAQALPASGADKVQAMRGLSGKGITVAVIDSGCTTQHPALAGAIVAEHCFTQGDCGAFASESESAEDGHNHGSNVTGIVASRGAGGVAKGYAPATSIVSVKVLNSNNAGQISDWVAGFDWIFSNRGQHDIRVINASLVSTAEYASASQCDSSERAMAMITKKLVDAGVTITGASGNTGHTATMTAPACNTGVIAVGATYDSDLGRQPAATGTYRTLGGASWPACSDEPTNTTTIACFTCTAGARLDLLAPGTQITSTGRGTGTSMFRGTSQAAPGVAGLAALMLECNPTLTPAKILELLEMTGTPVMDPRTGMSYPLIRGMEAVDAACPMGSAGSGGSTAAGSGGSAAGSGGGGGMGGATGTGGGAGAMAAGSGGSAGGSAAGAAGSTSVPLAGVGGSAGSGGATSPPLGPGAPAAGAAAVGGGSGGSVASPFPITSAPTQTRAADDSGCGCAVPGYPARAIPAPAPLVLLAFALLRRRRAQSRRNNARRDEPPMLRSS
jgi:MYXO-CTERM domain-containing protein